MIPNSQNPEKSVCVNKFLVSMGYAVECHGKSLIKRNALSDNLLVDFEESNSASLNEMVNSVSENIIDHYITGLVPYYEDESTICPGKKVYATIFHTC